MKTKICKQCNKEFKKLVSDSSLYWDKKMFCSKKCANNFNDNNKLKKGRKLTSDIIEKIKPTMFKKGQIPWNKGKKFEAISKEKHHNWKDGRTKETVKIRTSLEYKLWRTAVFERDNYTCIWCNTRCAKGVKTFLHADHILPFALYPELRLAIDNGRTLCKSCHFKRHNKKEF